MKSIMGVLVGVLSIAILAGCEKKENQPPMEEPMVTEETVVSETVSDAAANMIESVEPIANANVDMIADQAAAVIENPTNEQIQQALKGAGLYSGSIDGNIGPRTKKAIEDFQAQNGLKVDGKVGPRTWAKLGAFLATSIENAEASIAIEPILLDENYTNNDTNR